MAGDIGYLNDDNYSLHPFWDWASDNFRQTLVIPGNHEFYKSGDVGTIQNGCIAEIRPNVKCYYNTIVTIDNWVTVDDGIDCLLQKFPVIYLPEPFRLDDAAGLLRVVPNAVFQFVFGDKGSRLERKDFYAINRLVFKEEIHGLQ
ncbi:MAG: hypothetical protein LBS55_09720 [Prevotellaceae bacterium]|nr:hypothetical protein [Prevotellaceae bacterium]